jgi:bifunctional DNase/RNase
MLEMTVSQLTVDPFTNMPILILKSGEQALPIWIGLLEASAIATELEKIALDRPMTHDLLKNLIAESGLKVECVEIHDVKANTFYACIRLAGRKKAIALDSRPSDAIALALRTGAPIRVARKVVERMQQIDLGVEKKSRKKAMPIVSVKDAARLRDLLENLTDEHFGKWKM